MFLKDGGLRACVLLLLSAALVTVVTACAQVDLKTTLELQEISSGYHDAGITDAGLNKLVPGITFRIRNVSNQPVNSVDMVVFFWGVEFDQPKELDEVIVKAIGSDGLDPGAMTEPIVVRSKQGFSLEQPRAELFNHKMFRDTTARLFMKRGGKIVPFGEHTTERRLLLGAPVEVAGR